MIDRIKYELTKSAPSSIYRHLPLGRTHADIVASKLSAGKDGVVPERVAGEDAVASPNFDVAHCHGDAGPAVEFSPGKVRLLICAARGCLRLFIISATSTETGSEASKPLCKSVAFVRRRTHT